jgi:hypothetical protein
MRPTESAMRWRRYTDEYQIHFQRPVPPHPSLSRQWRGFYKALFVSRMVRVRFEFDDAFPDG